MTESRKKIEKIIRDRCYLESFEGVKQDELFDKNYKIKLSQEGKKDLETLFQQERISTIRDCAWYLGNEYTDKNGFVSPVVVNILDSMNEYLNQTSHGEDKDEV